MNTEIELDTVRSLKQGQLYRYKGRLDNAFTLSFVSLLAQRIKEQGGGYNLYIDLLINPGAVFILLDNSGKQRFGSSGCLYCKALFSNGKIGFIPFGTSSDYRFEALL